MDEHFDFLFKFPLRVLLISPSGDPDETGFEYSGAVVIKAGGGHECLPIFTDEDMLERFVSSKAVPANAERVLFEYPDSFAKFLSSIAKAGFATHVGFDPWKESVKVHPSIAELVEQLQLQFNLDD
jgi:hypothetical protein